MKKLTALLSSFALAATLSGCAVTRPINATCDAIGSKTGEASTVMILGMFYTKKGNAGIAAAAKNGGISKVSSVDYERHTLFPLIAYRLTTKVTGE